MIPLPNSAIGSLKTNERGIKTHYLDVTIIGNIITFCRFGAILTLSSSPSLSSLSSSYAFLAGIYFSTCMYICVVCKCHMFYNIPHCKSVYQKDNSTQACPVSYPFLATSRAYELCSYGGEQ